ncbi:hypothetical protein C8J57DRAFT_321590 [Mycena rebaudengoi]|nr:hypothetical protein C8J57DRAFT_321590 [Mycena rebaudengoi]
MPSAEPETPQFDWGTLSSPYISLLESNDRPPECDTPILRSIIFQGRARVACLDDRIAGLQSELERCILERDKLAENVGQFASVVSPLRGGIPHELLANIFLLSLPETGVDTPMYQAKAAALGPWIIGQVCRRWRVVALSHPRLWTSVVLDFRIPEETSFSVLILETQLQRSGKQPLTVIFRAFEHGESRSQHRAFQLILKESFRWETVALHIPVEVFPDIDCVQNQLPLLKDLRVDVLGCLPDGTTPVSRAFEIAPNLKRVTLKGLNSDPSTCPVDVVLPWTQLQWYRGNNTWPSHLDVLRSAINIVGACFSTISSAEAALVPIQFPQLLRFSARDSTFLYGIETPVLEEVIIFDYLSPVVSLLRRSSCPIKRLVCCECMDISCMEDILEEAPTITEFCIHIIYTANTIDFLSWFSADNAGVSPTFGSYHSHSVPYPPSTLEIWSPRQKICSSRWNPDGGRVNYAKCIYSSLLFFPFVCRSGAKWRNSSQRDYTSQSLPLRSTPKTCGSPNRFNSNSNMHHNYCMYSGPKEIQ